MHINIESPLNTRLRLQKVMSKAVVAKLDEAFSFIEVPETSFPSDLIPSAIAFIHDLGNWSALVPTTNDQQERFAIFSIHFESDADNSGFVGWLATHLKLTLGTGIFVICGQNSARGGIYDYWGVPIALADRVSEEIQSLKENGLTF